VVFLVIKFLDSRVLDIIFSLGSLFKIKLIKALCSTSDNGVNISTGIAMTSSSNPSCSLEFDAYLSLLINHFFIVECCLVVDIAIQALLHFLSAYAFAHAIVLPLFLPCNTFGGTKRKGVFMEAMISNC
jgi:hypothetical protein